MKPDLIRFDGDDDGDGEGSSSEQFQELIESLPTNLRLLLMQQVPPVEPPQTRELYLELLDLLKRTQEGIAKLAERLPPHEQLLSELPFECQKVLIVAKKIKLKGTELKLVEEVAKTGVAPIRDLEAVIDFFPCFSAFW